MEGTLSRTDIARSAQVDLQTLCDRTHRYDAEGPDGVKVRLRGGRPVKLDEVKKAEVRI